MNQSNAKIRTLTVKRMVLNLNRTNEVNICEPIIESIDMKFDSKNGSINLYISA